MPLAGTHGRYLRVDVTDGSQTSVPLPDDVLEQAIGGVGLGTWILAREAPIGVDPLAPDAPIIFAFSPLVGTPLTTSAKFAVVAKSPLTGFLTDALSSSHFALSGKRLGFDAICIVGRAAAPSIIVNGELEETDLWGRSAEETEAELSGRGRVAAIGVAGEIGVRYATISNDGRHAGRGGLGAVLGAKNVKAIVCTGTDDPPLADASRVVELSKSLSKRSLGPATAKYRELGTVGNLMTFNRLNTLPTRNFQESTFDGADALAAETLQPVREKAKKSCANCTIGCERIYTFGKDGKTTRIEYENLFALGPLCGVSDPDAVLEASKRCDDLGIDTISVGGSIAFLMECGERGLIDENEFGVAPRFGDADGLLDMIEQAGTRSGPFGALLAEGSRRMAERIGRDSIHFAPQVKGLEIPGYEPRELQTMALGFAVGTRGADHNRSGGYEVDFSGEASSVDTDERGRRALEPEDRAAIFDSAILCKFLRGVFDDLWGETSELLEAVTGVRRTPDALREVARDIVHLKKAFNVREGWHPADDALPERFLTPAANTAPSGGPAPVPGGPAPLDRAELQSMIRAYNLARGWDVDGFLGVEIGRRPIFRHLTSPDLAATGRGIPVELFGR